MYYHQLRNYQIKAYCASLVDKETRFQTESTKYQSILCCYT